MSPIVPGFCALPGAHYLNPQTSSRVPRRYLFFDTEAHRKETPLGEVQTWRLGVSATVVWRERTRTWTEPKYVRHTTPEELWDAITAFAKRDARTVVCAHNLAYDLRISRGLEMLPAAGWAVERPTFSGEHVALEAAYSGSRLLFVDSLTLLPAGLADIGRLLDQPKPPLPSEDDPDEVWWDRCQADVGILSRAYMTIIEWLDKDDLGGWARTGPGTGWHVMLRSHLRDKVLVHGREDVRKAECSAMAAGRAEVWKHGQLKGGPWYEWDYRLAYANVCRDEALPTVLVGEVHGRRLPQMLGDGGRQSYLVEAAVATDVPVLPWADDLGICWPIGRFHGWWWAHELAEAVEAGATIKVIRAYRYKAAPWLASWATWCMAQVEDQSTPEARVRGLAAKHWTRAVVGRSAMKYRSWEPRGAAWRPGVGYMALLDLDSGARGAALTLGDQRWEAWGMEWSDNAFPQLLSAVMAHCRVRLWRALQAAGLDHVAYCDTDSLIVDPAGHQRLQQAVPSGSLWSLRLKGHHAHLEVTAPQLVEGSTYRRLAGVPRGAKRTGPATYDAEVWEGITGAMAGGHPGEVRVRRTTLALAGVDTRRLHLPGGATAPFTVVDGRRQVAQEVAS